MPLSSTGSSRVKAVPCWAATRYGPIHLGASLRDVKAFNVRLQVDNITNEPTEKGMGRLC